MTQFKVDHKPREARVETLYGYSALGAASRMLAISFCIAAFMLLLWPGHVEVDNNPVLHTMIYLAVSIALCWIYFLRGRTKAESRSNRLVRYQVSDGLGYLCVVMPCLAPIVLWSVLILAQVTMFFVRLFGP